MAPPTTLPRLSSIVPEQLAQATVERVLEQLAQLSTSLAPGIALHVDRRGGLPAAGLYLSIVDLCAWAQRGAGEPEEVNDLCLSVASVIYPRPLDGREEDGLPEDLRTDADPETEIGVVIVAALARERLGRGEALPARELAALAGVSSAHVRLLVRTGELAGEKRRGEVRVRAAAARRWLAGRQVPGFAA